MSKASTRVLQSGLSRIVHPRDETRETVLNQPSKQVSDLPFYPLLPRDPVELLKWKIYARKRALHDLEFRADILKMCREDICFFASTFTSVFEPRPPREIPLTLWDDQADVLVWMQECLLTERDCIAADTLVVTDRGNVPIQDVKTTDRVWDGVEWVLHDGLLVKGVRDTIEVFGVSVTPDHLVLTKRGWCRAENAKGTSRADVRAPEGRGVSRKREDEIPVRMRRYPSGGVSGCTESSRPGRRCTLLPKMPATDQLCPDPRPFRDADVSNLVSHESPLFKSERRRISLLRRAGNNCVRTLAKVRKLFSRYGRTPAQSVPRSDRQRQRVRTRKLSVGYANHSIEQPPRVAAVRNEPRIINRISNREDCSGERSNRTGSCKGWMDRGRLTVSLARSREPENAAAAGSGHREVPVYDLANCGPRNRFAVVSRDGGLLLVHNCGVEKSRGLGLSWNLMILYYHTWYFMPGAKLGVMSKDEQTLDGPDANFLLGKFQYIHDHVPAWMRFDSAGRNILRRNLTEHTFVNMLTDATLQGYPPVESKVRGLRFTSFAYDEFAFFPRNTQDALNASSHTTPNRFFISTWNGPGNAFHDLMNKISSTMLRIKTYWWNNPERFKGAYKYEGGRLQIMDPSYRFPEDYPFVEDGLLRSPWVDYELSRPRTGTFQSALEELFGLQAESGRKFFSNVVHTVLDTTTQAPGRRGSITEIRRQPTFTADRDGDVWIWGDVGLGIGGPFAAGCDLGFGRGAAYSAMVVFDLSTGEQVLEYATNTTPIVEFAATVISICRWLAGAKGDGHVYLSFENNQEVGVAFGEELLRIGYGNIERREVKRVRRNQKPFQLGMRNKDGGLMVLTELERAILQGECSIRSPLLAEEFSLMDRDESGRPVFPRTGDGHGDRIQGAGIAWYIGRNRRSQQSKRQVAAESYHQAVIEELTRPTTQRKMFSDVWRITGPKADRYGL